MERKGWRKWRHYNWRKPSCSISCRFATKSVSGAVLLLIPVSEVVKGLLDAVLLRVTKPRFVPRLALRRGIPPEGRTLCVIAALLTSPADAHALCARLEEYYLCNRDALGQLTFGLLADLPEADMALLIDKQDDPRRVEVYSALQDLVLAGGR